MFVNKIIGLGTVTIQGACIMLSFSTLGVSLIHFSSEMATTIPNVRILACPCNVPYIVLHIKREDTRLPGVVLGNNKKMSSRLFHGYHNNHT